MIHSLGNPPRRGFPTSPVPSSTIRITITITRPISATTSALLVRHKFTTSFNGTTVTHTTQKWNLEAKQRRVEVTTVWTTEQKLGTGVYGVFWGELAHSGREGYIQGPPEHPGAGGVD